MARVRSRSIPRVRASASNQALNTCFRVGSITGGSNRHAGQVTSNSLSAPTHGENVAEQFHRGRLDQVEVEERRLVCGVISSAPNRSHGDQERAAEWALAGRLCHFHRTAAAQMGFHHQCVDLLLSKDRKGFLDGGRHQRAPPFNCKPRRDGFRRIREVIQEQDCGARCFLHGRDATREQIRSPTWKRLQRLADTRLMDCGQEKGAAAPNVHSPVGDPFPSSLGR